MVLGGSVLTEMQHQQNRKACFKTVIARIDDPEEYNNQGKYFLMLGNSCYAGNIFEGSNNYSEKFINIAGKGAIAYVSPSATGQSVVLNATCSEFYSQLCNKSYGKSLGYCIQKALKYVTDNFGREYMDYTLNGDPCYFFHWEWGQKVWP